MWCVERSADYRHYGNDWSVLCFAMGFSCWCNWCVGIHLDRRVFIFCLWHPLPYKKMCMWQSWKTFAIHKAIKNKSFCCAENFNWSWICTVLPQILKCLSLLVCLCVYDLRLHHLVLTWLQEKSLEAQHTLFFAGLLWLGRSVRISSATREHCNYTLQPAGPISRSGSTWCCLFLSSAFP